MQSLAVIPDIHMRHSVFQHALDLADAGHQIVFLGDYADNGPKPNDPDFLKKIFTFVKQQNAIALIGNHDLPYLYPDQPRFRKTGYEPDNAEEMAAVYEQFRDYLKFGYCKGRYVFSHAGFSRKLVRRLDLKYGASTAAQVVKLLNTREVPETYFCGPANGGGDALDGPLWLRLPQYDGCWESDGLLQVTGHSSQSTIRFRKNLLMIDVQLPLLLEW